MAIGREPVISIEGTVSEVVYMSPETGFAVIEVETDEELLPVVGELYGVSEGEELRLTGSYSNHPKFGRQFKAMAYERRMPATAAAVRKFLSSGAVKGIGAVLASRIVDTFGDDTMTILEETPGRLTEVKGISPKKADAIIKELGQMFGMRSAMNFLSSYGLTPAEGVRAWKKWGPITVDVVKDNPYLLCDEEIGVEFKRADEIALSVGIEADSGKRLFGAASHVLRHNLKNGHTCLARQTVVQLVMRLTGVEEAAIEADIDQRIEEEELFSVQKNREFLFLPSMYNAERYIAMRLSMMLQNRFFVSRNIDEMIDRTEAEKGIHYESLQREAIREALQKSMLILTGGPGTGKTTTLNAIIDLLEDEGLSIAIAAPTGRAAKRVSEVTGRDAKTIHRLLEVDFGSSEVTTFVHNEQHPLKADAVVIDEMSMVDTTLFESLLRGCRMGCKLILVGDSDQLPSVGPGNVLRDLIDSGCIPTVELKQVFRQAAESRIVTNAHRIVAGEYPDLKTKDNDFFFLRRQSAAAVLSTVTELVAKRLPASYGYSPLEDIQVLTPQRKGDLGVGALNESLQAALNPPQKGKREYKSTFATFREGDKVLQTRNNYDIEWKKPGTGEKGMGIYNGDIGIIQRIDLVGGTMEIDFDGRRCEYTLEMAPELDLAYAVTVHKSQGSEYSAVVLPIFGGYDKLYFRNLLYTAVTRARKLLIIVGSESRVYQMVDNNRKMLRYTGLKWFLRQEAGKPASESGEAE
ncbi:MAG TPA: ATP-dependent RecD-like DNA helicase [Candidatus Faecivivens stercoravium]|uniref:ATP-dependent RecD2 DNA helicase n=1 Tax=Candidatus Faecivivens stercoravium TaxID=2840803 RepID=A0A9D1DWN0_9FIRM|nr:ATP-dependent RecD-like DNA helicase [Candidatus Faecivivens stercoravium]